MTAVLSTQAGSATNSILTKTHSECKTGHEKICREVKERQTETTRGDVGKLRPGALKWPCGAPECDPPNLRNYTNHNIQVLEISVFQ